MGKARGVQQHPKERVDADDGRHVRGLERADEGRHVARIGDQHGLGPMAEERQGTRECEHVVQGQRDDQGLLAVLQFGRNPCTHLHHVGHHVAVGQHGAFGHSGGAAGVLQEGQVCRCNRYLIKHMPTPGGHRLPPRHGPRQPPGRHQLLDVFDHRVGQPSLQRRQHVAHLRGHHRTHGDAGDDLLHGVREVFYHHQSGHARVVELVLQFARRVQRVDVDHHQTRSQHRKQGHRHLQQVGHHQTHAFAALQSRHLLQPGGQCQALGIKLREARNSPTKAVIDYGRVQMSTRGRSNPNPTRQV